MAVRALRVASVAFEPHSYGGARGFLVAIDPRELSRVLGVTPVEVGIAS